MKKCFLAGSALWLLAMPALAQQTGDVVVFGDSLSDPGNIPSLTGGVNFPPAPPYADNRFSNGPVYSELLPGLVGSVFDPSLNFAVGGALTGPDNSNSNRPSADPSSDLSGIVLPGIESQIDGFLASDRRLGSADLVIVYGGASDVLVAAETAATLPSDQIPNLVRTTAATAAQNLTTGVGRLSAAGGDFFVLPNLPDIGATPAFTAGGAASTTLGRSFAAAHNLALDQAAADLQDQIGGNIIVFDVNGIFDDIQANPERYGVSNVTDACIDTPSCVGADPATQNQFLFFDGVHPTAGVHARVAQLLATTVRAPSTLAALGDVTLIAAEDFQRTMIESFNPVAATASVELGPSGKPVAELDTATTNRSDTSKATSLFLLVDQIDGDRDERSGALGYRYDLGSVTAGLRRKLSSNVALGAAFRIGSGDADSDGGAETFDHRQVQLGLSVTLGEKSSYIVGLANLGYAQLRSIERRTGIRDITTTGETDGVIFGASVAAGHLIPLASVRP